jgi:hypothetical protein
VLLRQVAGAREFEPFGNGDSLVGEALVEAVVSAEVTAARWSCCQSLPVMSSPGDGDRDRRRQTMSGGAATARHGHLHDRFLEPRHAQGAVKRPGVQRVRVLPLNA